MLYVLGGVAIVGIGVAVYRSNAMANTVIETPRTYAEIHRIGAILESHGAPSGLRYMLGWRAHSESGRAHPNNLACNGDRCPAFAANTRVSDSDVLERKAAERAWAAFASTLEASPYSRDQWCFGSGGWYGLLGPYSVGFLRHDKAHASDPRFDPWCCFDPWRSSVAFADMLRRTMALGNWRNLPAQHRTWIALQRAGASLATMADYQETGTRAKAVRRNAPTRLRGSGAPADFADRVVPPFGPQWNAIDLWDLEPRAVPFPPQDRGIA